MNADAMHSISGALRRQVKLHGAGNTQTRMFRCSPPVTLRLSWSPWMRLRDSLVSQCRLRATIICEGSDSAWVSQGAAGGCYLMQHDK